MFGFAGRRRIWWSEGGSVSSPQKSLSILMSFISFALISNASIRPVVCFCFIMPLDLDCDAAANKTVRAIRFVTSLCVCAGEPCGSRQTLAKWEGQTRLRVTHTFLPRLRGLKGTKLVRSSQYNQPSACACTVYTSVNPNSLNMTYRSTSVASLTCSVDTASQAKLN